MIAWELVVNGWRFMQPHSATSCIPFNFLSIDHFWFYYYVIIILCLLFRSFWKMNDKTFVCHIRSIDSQLRPLMPLMRSFESLFHFIRQINKFLTWAMSNGKRLWKQYERCRKCDEKIYIKKTVLWLNMSAVWKKSILRAGSCSKQLQIVLFIINWTLNIEHRWEFC